MNRLKSIFTITLLFVCITLSYSQVKKSFHNTYLLQDIETVQVDIVGEVEVKYWKSKTLMIGTFIELGNATQGILNHLVDNKKRYDLEDSADGTNLNIMSFDKERKAVITQNGSCDEKVSVVIYVPNDFEILQNKTLLVRKEQEIQLEITGDE